MENMIGECDVCGKQRELRRIVAYGIDTYACPECLGEDPYDDINPDLDFESLKTSRFP